MGFVFIPLQVVAFATLPVVFRTDAAALFSLMRNVGSAVGISVATLVLAKSTFILHNEIAESVTALNPMLHTGPAGMMFNPAFPMGLAALDHAALVQAQIAAYRNDFILMFWASFPAAVAVLLMRPPKPRTVAGEAEAEAAANL
jgi:DHA2 family multidrug resistance protein